MLTTIPSKLQSSDLFKGDPQLTSPPNVYFELQKIISNPDKSIEDVAFVIEHDPALTIRILKVVNSAFFGLPAPVASITRAISIIGVQALQNLVLATVVIDKFSSLPGGLLSMHDFWARSVRCALLSKEICIYRNKKDELDSMFICGLLHDIGQLVFYRKIPELARHIGLLVESSGADEVETENSVLGFNHYQTGSELAKLWRLPEIISETIGQHNHPEYSGVFADAASIIRAANYLCKMTEENSHPDNFCSDISKDDLSDIIDKTHNQFEVIFKFFYH